MLIIRCLRIVVAFVVGVAVAGGDDGRPAAELVGWKAAWSVPAGETASLSVVSGESLIVAAPEGTVTVRDADSGAVRRIVRTSVPDVTDVWATAGTLVVGGGPRGPLSRNLYGYDLVSGRALWQHALPSSEGGVGNLPQVVVSEYGVVVFQQGFGSLSLDVRTGGVQARAGDLPGCDVVTTGVSRSVLLLSRCGHGRVRLDSFDARTLRRNWTRPVTTGGGGVRLWFRKASEGFVIAGVDDEEFLFARDGTPLPRSRLGEAAAGNSSLEVGHHPDAEGHGGFDWNNAWPLPGYLLSRDEDTGRVGAYPLDRPLTHTTGFVGATSRLVFLHGDDRITAFRPVYGRPRGPVALGGVPLGDWPDACSLLTSRDLGQDVRRVPGRGSLGRLTLPRPVTCDWVPSGNDDVVSLSVSWVSPDAGALFAAAVEQTKRYESYDYDPTGEGGGLFSYTAHGPGGTFGVTLVNVGPVIVHLTSPSRLVQRLAAVRVRDNLLARYRPGARVRAPEPTGGWTLLADAGVRADPVVDGGVVYAGADDGMYALDAATGRTRWKSRPAAPRLVDGMLYGVGDDGVAAVDAGTGRSRWRRRFDAGDVVIQDGGVYAGVGFAHVVALEADSGRQRWRFRVPGDLGRVAVAAGTVYVSSGKGREGLLSALDARTGALRWRARLGVANSTPAGCLTATGEAVFVTTGTNVFALDPASGETRWSARFGEIVGYDPVVIGGTVYLGDLSGRTYALNAASGKERWRLTTAGGDSRWSVAGSRGTVYVGGRELHALDPVSGAERWSGPPEARVSVHEDTVFAQDEGGTLHALDAATGTPRWRFRTGGRFQTLPVVAGGLVYVGSSNGDLYALRARDGLPGPVPYAPGA